MTALLLALWAGDAAAATIRLTVSPSRGTVGEAVTVTAKYSSGTYSSSRAITLK